MVRTLLAAIRHHVAVLARPCAIADAWLGFEGSAYGYQPFGTENPMNTASKRPTRRLGRLTT